MRMAEDVGGDAGDEVEIDVAVGVPDARALAALHHQLTLERALVVFLLQRDPVTFRLLGLLLGGWTRSGRHALFSFELVSTTAYTWCSRQYSRASGHSPTPSRRNHLDAGSRARRPRSSP